MSETISAAVARRDNSPAALIKQYSESFAQVLPSHVKPATWVRLAQGALKRGKRGQDGRFELEVAAANNPGAFLAALLDAARLGLDPGTEQYYLTPRKVGGRLEILGIVGYQGHIELMYRAGAVASVVAEVVREHDEYRYQRGIDRVPIHRFKPFASEKDRGALIGVYAYAHMKDGSVSRVVELSRDDIERIKRSSASARSENSPWVVHEAAMWLKSAVRQLQKWVPTSAEYRREMARTAAEAQRVANEPTMPEGTASAVQADYIDGDVVEDAADVGDVPPADDDWPTPATPGGEAR